MLLKDSWEKLNVEGFPDKDIVIRGKRRNGKERERKKNEVKGEETVFWTISEFLDTDLYLLIYLLFCFLEAYKGTNNSRGWEVYDMTRFAVDTLLVNSFRLKKALTKLRTMLQQHLTENNVFFLNTAVIVRFMAPTPRV